MDEFGAHDGELLEELFERPDGALPLRRSFGRGVFREECGQVDIRVLPGFSVAVFEQGVCGGGVISVMFQERVDVERGVSDAGRERVRIGREDVEHVVLERRRVPTAGLAGPAPEFVSVALFPDGRPSMSDEDVADVAAGIETVLFSQSCHNKEPKTGSLNNRHLFLPVLEAGA